MRIHLHFDDENDKTPMLVLDGKVLTASVVEYTKADGLRVADASGNFVVGKRPEQSAVAAQETNVARNIHEYFRRLDEDD